MPKNIPQLRIGAHVLVQLGSELVTDVEQAILECVKNAYDADSPGCLIEIESKEENTLVEHGTGAQLRRFLTSTDTVKAELCDAKGNLIAKPAVVKDDQSVQRRLHCTGRISIEDHGTGMAPAQLLSSWLVISQSGKRKDGSGPKEKTKGGRTPLGDKGVGRLGSMKLGDVLVVETATSDSGPIQKAQFRWADCEVAATVDEIPVFVTPERNSEGFKGTKVSVFGLRELSEWQARDRAVELARSLAKLISPFESRATFPVKIVHDGVDLSLDRITNDTLKQAVAEFQFNWDSKRKVLSAEARFKKRLFMSRRSDKLADRTDRIFGKDEGKNFAEYLPTARRIQKVYDHKAIDLEAPWFIDLKSKFEWNAIAPSKTTGFEDPGSFSGAFYFFHFDNSEESDASATSGLGFDKDLIKGMSGITILRDGFRVRSQGDWLDISAAMTSGSTYNMRVDNTVGYFALTGEENHSLIEKSDREGFVEDAAYRGFLQIATYCRNFANNALENVRRSLDDFAKTSQPAEGEVAPTAELSLQVVEKNLRSAKQARTRAETVAAELQQEITKIEQSTNGETAKQATSNALRIASNAVKAIEGFSKQLSESIFPELDLQRIKQEFEERNERSLMLLESAAVGLSARGLAHELRTHLMDIRQRTNALEKIARRKNADPQILPGVRDIRASCNAIIRAAGLIDPMLPRTRATKEEIDVRSLIEEYLETRRGSIESNEIKTVISGAGKIVRANRSRLIQILDNLVRNSIYWLRRGEKTGEVSRQKTIHFRLNNSGLVIWDSGPGVNERHEDTLFDLFVSGRPPKDGGQGLGLFIVKQLLQIDGCDIELLNERNEDGRRYKFSINFGPLVKV